MNVDSISPQQLAELCEQDPQLDVIDVRTPVGVGLLFAGVTDTCGMGLLLAKMPWNQRASEPTSDLTEPAAECCATSPSGRGRPRQRSGEGEAAKSLASKP